MKRLRRAVSCALVINLCLSLVAPAAGQEQQKPPYLDPSLSIDKRVDDLVCGGALHGRGSADGGQALNKRGG